MVVTVTVVEVDDTQVPHSTGQRELTMAPMTRLSQTGGATSAQKEAPSGTPLQSKPSVAAGVVAVVAVAVVAVTVVTVVAVVVMPFVDGGAVVSGAAVFEAHESQSTGHAC